MSEVDSVIAVETVTDIQTETVAETIATLDILSVSEVEVIAETMPLAEVLEVYGTELITETVEIVEVLTEGTQGPPGPPGPAGTTEEDMTYARRLDMVSESLMYRGEAAAGSSETDPVWRIRRITVTLSGALVDVSEQWANGDGLFNNVWADRASLSYS